MKYQIYESYGNLHILEPEDATPTQGFSLLAEFDTEKEANDYVEKYTDENGVFIGIGTQELWD